MDPTRRKILTTGTPATTGMRVCHTHGGQAPQVREAARLRAALARLSVM
jgi:hypothetical protein